VSMETVPCRSCGALLIWGVNARGERVPVDAEPRKRITLWASRNPALPPLASLIDTYVSHWQTCPSPEAQKRRAAQRSQGNSG
jgi:hypothetical protein